MMMHLSHHRRPFENRRHSELSLWIPGGETSVSFCDSYDNESANPSTSTASLDFVKEKDGRHSCFELRFNKDSPFCSCLGNILCSFCRITGATQLNSTLNFGPLSVHLSQIHHHCRRRETQREPKSEERLTSLRGRGIVKSSNVKCKARKHRIIEALLYTLTPENRCRAHKWQTPHRILARARSLSSGSRIPISTALNNMFEKSEEHDDDVVFSALGGGLVMKHLSLQNLSLFDEPTDGVGHDETPTTIVTSYEDDLCTKFKDLHSPNYEDFILDENVSHLEAEMEGCSISPSPM